MSISIIVPAYDEECLIGSTIDAIQSYLILNNMDGEITIINDGSTDKTRTIVEGKIASNKTRISLKLINNNENQGKGYSVRKGMLASSGEIRVFMDADLPYNLNLLLEIRSKILNGSDVVIGDRNNPQSKLIDIHPLRKIAGRIYSAFVQLLIKDGITDTQCGLKGFSAESAQIILSRTRINGFGFDVEVLRIAQKHAMTISKVPVEMINNRADSRVQLIQDSLLMLLNLILIRTNELFGYYD
jgi:dolichyl-phosphate beta-glucosyltransferase